MIEHRHLEGNRLVLTLLGALASEECTASADRPDVLVSVYRYDNAGDTGYLVRAHIEALRLDAELAIRLVSGERGFATEAQAWAYARDTFEWLVLERRAQQGGAVVSPLPLRFDATRERLVARCFECGTAREFDRAQAAKAREELHGEGWLTAQRNSTRVSLCGGCARPTRAARVARTITRGMGAGAGRDDGDGVWLTGDAITLLLQREARTGSESWRAAAQALLDERLARRVAA